MKLINTKFIRYEGQRFFGSGSVYKFQLFRFKEVETMADFDLFALNAAVSDFIKSLTDRWIGITPQVGYYHIVDIQLSKGACNVEVKFTNLSLHGCLEPEQKTPDGTWRWKALNIHSFIP